MDTYFTIEEKYLHAVEELNYGETPKSLQLLNDIINTEPQYARAHYQLGLVYFYHIKDYQLAGYHLKLCIDLEPKFPDAYIPYIDLLVFLNMRKQVAAVSQNALQVPGTNNAEIFSLMAQSAEKNGDWPVALELYRKALLASTYKKQVTCIEESIDRVQLKVKTTKAYSYQLID